MHTFNSTVDPLDKELDFSHMKIEKTPYMFDFKEKINVWLETLYDSSNVTKDKFYEVVENSLRAFCNKSN